MRNSILIGTDRRSQRQTNSSDRESERKITEREINRERDGEKE